MDREWESTAIVASLSSVCVDAVLKWMVELLLECLNACRTVPHGLSLQPQPDESAAPVVTYASVLFASDGG